jgi:hypothetical protein
MKAFSSSAEVLVLAPVVTLVEHGPAFLDQRLA